MGARSSGTSGQPTANLARLERIVGSLPEAQRHDIAEWGSDHMAFRVRGKNFVFCDSEGRSLDLKLSKDEAAALAATDPQVVPSGYGLGRHGWITLTLELPAGEGRWRQVEEWVRTSYTLIAPKMLARLVIAQDASSPPG